MTTKKKIFIAGIVLITLLILFLIWWLLLFRLPTKTNITTVSNNSDNVANSVDQRREKDSSTTTATIQSTIKSSGLESLASAFAERYGSFSSESNMANLKDLLNFMSAGLRTKTENYIASTHSSSEYYGVTTKVLAVKINSLNETGGMAEVEVSTQREE